MRLRPKGTQLGRCYRLVAALMSGKQLDRHAISAMLGVKLAAADTHIKEIEIQLPTAVRTQRKGNKKILSWRGDGQVVTASRSLAVAASFGTSVAQLFRGTSYATLLDQTRESVIGRLKTPEEFAHARRKFLFISQAGEVALPDRQGLLDDLVEAVLKQQLVEVDYTGFEGEQRRETIAPWSLAIYDHQLYILAGDGGATPRPYRLSRIRRHRVLEKKTFEYPPRTTYDPEHLFRDSFGIFIRGEGEVEEVRLRFQPRWRTFARTHLWHSTHQVERDDDAGVVVRMRVRICRELEAFVLSFGAEVEVLAPASLRSSISDRAASLAVVYQKGPAEPFPPEPVSRNDALPPPAMTAASRRPPSYATRGGGPPKRRSNKRARPGSSSKSPRHD